MGRCSDAQPPGDTHHPGVIPATLSVQKVASPGLSHHPSPYFHR